MKSFLGLFFVLVAVFVVAGCSDDDDTAGPGTPDTTPPVVTAVTAIHSFALEVTYNEVVTAKTAEKTDNYRLTNNVMASNDPSPNRSPSAEIVIAAAALYPDGRTVLLSTDTGMTAAPHSLEVNRISDVHGNVMTEASVTDFTGTEDADNTAPTITYHDPANGANGVGTAQSVFVTFSEPMRASTVYAAFSWALSGGGSVSFAMSQRTANTYVFTAVSPLAVNRTFNVSVSGAAEDLAGNSFAGTSWTFKTRSTIDTTPPTLVGSTPADGSTDAPVDGALKIEFSEPINPLSLDDVAVTPDPGEGTVEWIDGGKTFVFLPDLGLSTNTQYAMTFPRGGIKDLSGNAMSETVTILFTTGASFAGGSIAGTLSGDAFSVNASDPTGAIVVATTTNLFGRVEEDVIDIYGTGTVGGDDTYLVERLPDNVYYPFAIMDSNNDGILNPELGDAIGAFGVDIRNMDESADPVVITSGAAVAEIDFVLFDPHAIFGTVVYAGQQFRNQLYEYGFRVGAYDVNGFDPENLGSPDAGTQNGSLAQDPFYRMDTFNGELMAGTYYLFAFLDVNGNGNFDPAEEPSGFYSNPDDGNRLPVTVENGSDAGGIDIYLEDPSTAARTATVVWETARPNDHGLSAQVRRAQAAIRRALEELDDN